MISTVQMGKGGSERTNDLPKIRQLAKGIGRAQTWACITLKPISILSIIIIGSIHLQRIFPASSMEITTYPTWVLTMLGAGVPESRVLVNQHLMSLKAPPQKEAHEGGG